LWYNLDCDVMKELLKTLTETFSPSGYEQAIRDVIREEITPLADPRVVAWRTRTAEENKTPGQREVLAGAGTDAHAIQLARAGVLAGGLGTPCRYVH